MKILVLSVGFGLNEHNLFGPLSETFVELANLGHQVVVISRDTNSTSAQNYYRCQNNGYVKVLKLTQQQGIKKFLFPFEIYKTIKKLHLEYNFDLIYSHIIPFMTIPALYFKNKYNLKHIYWVCSDWIPEKRFLKSKFNFLIQKYIQTKTDIILTCTDYCQTNDSKRFDTNNNKFRKLANSVNMDRYSQISSKQASLKIRKKYNLSDNVNIILYFSSLSFRKGAINLVNSIQYLQKKTDNFIVLFCGPSANGEIEMFNDILNKKNLQEYAIFTGAIASSEAPLYYNGCDIFCVLPEYEGFGRVFVEASAAKKPILASNIGGIPEIIEDNYNGLLVQRDDYKAISEKLFSLIENRDSAVKLANNAYNKAVEEYDVKVIAKKMESIFQEVLSD